MQLPQLLANYKAQSADGLSMTFLVVWLMGDVSNLIGACRLASCALGPTPYPNRLFDSRTRISLALPGVCHIGIMTCTDNATGALLTRLAPTAIALAIYFCILDTILISQALYYNTINARRLAREENAEAAEASEDSPLLARRRSSSAGLPGSHIRHATHEESSMEPLRKMVTGEDETPDSRPWLHNTLGLIAVYVVGFAGWFVSYKAGAWDGEAPSVPESPDGNKLPLAIVGLLLGYASAAFYLWYVTNNTPRWREEAANMATSARIPQIVKNHREKSCEGMLLEHGTGSMARLT